MNKDINLQAISTKWEVNKEDGYIFCEKRVKLIIYGVEHIFEAIGHSFCQDNDKWDQSFGEALAWIRASRVIGDSVEQCLIKYSCTKNIGEVHAILKLNIPGLDNAIAKVDELIKNLHKVEGKHAKQ